MGEFPHERADRDVRAAKHNVEQLRTAKDAEDANTRPGRADGGARRPPTPRCARRTTGLLVSAGRERTYHEGNSRGGGPFLRDVLAQFLYRDIEAEQRLMRHMQEERVERGAYLRGGRHRCIRGPSRSRSTSPRCTRRLWLRGVRSRT